MFTPFKKNTAHLSAIGTAFAVGLAMSPSADAAGSANPFLVADLGSGYMVAAMEDKGGEGKCAGKSGDKKASEGNCAGDKGKEGECAAKQDKEEKKGGEGKCGEGKCANT